jgi:hypothetical protein
MSAFDRCITEALAAKRITQKRADELRDIIDRRISAQDLDPSEAGQAARGIDALDALEADALRRKANAVRQVRSDRVNVAQMTTHPKGPIFGAMAHVVRDITGIARHGNADSQGDIIASRLRTGLDEAMASLRAKGVFGQKQDFALAEQAALEMRGKDTGSASAKGIAKAFGDAFEQARLLFNQAGGNIRARADYGTPQWHNEQRVASVPMAEWRSFIEPLVDHAKMVRPDGSPMRASDLPEFFEAAYADIIGSTVSRRGSAAANRHMDHRSIVFKDADSWLAYNRRFGDPDIYGGFMRHLDRLGHEIGQMQVLGPNPEAGVLAIQDALAKAGSPEAARRIGNLWETVRGNGIRPASTESMREAIKSLSATRIVSAAASKTVSFLQGVRQLNTSTKLGGAAVTSVADEATMAQTALWNGLSPVRIMKEQIAQLTKEERNLFAIRAGIAWDSWARTGVATSRFTDEATGRGLAARAAEGTMRASGLNTVTDARRAAFGMEFLGALGDMAGKSLDEVRTENAALAGALERYGFNAHDWDALRTWGRVDFDGATYIHPEAFLGAKAPPLALQRVANNLMRMIHQETDFAVPTPRGLERYIATAGTQAGTVTGEVFRHLFQFKTFPITMMTTHLARGLYQGTPGKKAAYLVPFALMTTGAGAVVLQAKALLQGRDPLDMTQPAFWGAANIQGGGASLFGDFLYQGVTGSNRFGNSFIVSMMGPTAGMADDAAKVVFKGIQGEASPKNVVDFATRHLIPGSSLWYARTGFDRLVKDQLMLLADAPAARRSFAARDKFYKEQGSRFWWKQGDLLPFE